MKVAVNILDDLLFYDKLDSGILKTNKKKSEIKNLIEQTFQSFSAQAKEREIIYELLSIPTRRSPIERGAYMYSYVYMHVLTYVFVCSHMYICMNIYIYMYVSFTS
jgi:signal transduction histidine kinase